MITVDHQTQRKNLRDRLSESDPLVVPFAWDPLTARLAEAGGADAVFISGYAVCASLGMPDLGIVTEQEMVSVATAVCRVSGVPIMVDGDDAHGSGASVQRTIEDFESAGISAIQIEDQPFPKRSGLLTGKQVLPLPDMVSKLGIALAARTDPNFLIIGRTDSVEQHGLDEAIKRAKAFADIGCDLVLITEIPDQRGLERCAHELAGTPMVYLGADLTKGQLAELGFSLQLWSGAMRPAWAEYLVKVHNRLRPNSPAPDLPSALRDATDLDAYENIRIRFEN